VMLIFSAFVVSMTGMPASLCGDCDVYAPGHRMGYCTFREFRRASRRMLLRVFALGAIQEFF